MKINDRSRYEVTEYEIAEGISFDKCGRMDYHPDYHFNHRKPLTEEDKEYICKYHDIDGLRAISFAIGKTEKTIANFLHHIKKDGKYEYYRNSNKYYI